MLLHYIDQLLNDVGFVELKFKTPEINFQLSDRFGNHSCGAEIMNVCHCFPSVSLWQRPVIVINYSTFPL